MKIELRRVSYNSRLSQETPAFAADIWIDGKKRGTVSNDGRGGCHQVQPWSLAEEIDVWAKPLPVIKGKYADYPQDYETVISGLLERHLCAKHLKRMLKAKTLFVRGGGIYETKLGQTPQNAEAVFNNLPFETALDLYVSVHASKN